MVSSGRRSHGMPRPSLFRCSCLSNARFRVLAEFSLRDWSSPLQHSNQDDDDRQHQQHVNESTQGVGAHETNQPQDEEYDRDSCQKIHSLILPLAANVLFRFRNAREPAPLTQASKGCEDQRLAGPTETARWAAEGRPPLFPTGVLCRGS